MIFEDEQQKIANIANKELLIMQQGIVNLNNTIDENFCKIINILSKSKGRIIFCSVGKSYWVSKKISATMASLGVPSFCVHAGEASHGDMGMITGCDSVIFVSNSGTTKELLPVVDYCKKLAIKTFCITSVATSFLAQNCEYKIILPSFNECMEPLNPPTTSTLLTLAIGDIAAVCLAKLRGFNATDYSRLHPGGAIGLATTNAERFIAERKSKNQTSYANCKVHEACTLQQGIAALNHHNLGIVICTDEQNRLKSCFSDGDLKRLVATAAEKGDDISAMMQMPLQNFCKQNPSSLTLNSSLLDVVTKMKTLKISHVIITDENNTFVDIIDKKDVITWL